MYVFADAALLRVAAQDTRTGAAPWPDLSGSTPDHVLQWRQWLRQVWASEQVLAAIELASPDLARHVRDLCSGAPLSARQSRRVVIAVIKYLLRSATRATPFGLFAGVAPVRVGDETDIRFGAAHSGWARVDTEWLAEVITHLESCPELLARLPVVVSDLVFVRDGRLVIGCRRRPGPAAAHPGPAAAEVSVRVSRPVAAVVRAARSPVRVGDLAVVLAAEFPGTRAEVIDDMLAALVALQILVTGLHPPMTVTDPLTHVVEHAEEAGAAAVPQVAPLLRELQEIRLDLHRHDQATTTGRRRALRASVAARMGTLSPAERPLGVDLRVDCAAVIPSALVGEAEAAATALARLTPTPTGSAAWTDYHRRFLDRYGIGAMIPVLDILNPDTGLGYPAGFRDSTLALPARRLDTRDVALMAMAQRAAIEQEREVVLDDQAVADLQEDGVASAPPQPHTELRFQVHAPTRAALNSGDFLLSVTGVSRAAGTTTGRFLDLLEPGDRERMFGVYAAMPTTSTSALVAQVSCPPVNPRAENVARSPQVLPHRITLSEHDTAAPGRIPLTDLAVSGDTRGLYLMSVSRRRPVEATTFSAVEFTRSAHPMLRFLCEISTARSALCVPFTWGAARRLPFLPRVRYGRTILSPARWSLAAADLPAASERHWVDDVGAWRRRYRVPDAVYLGEDDRRLQLDLTEPTHLHVLRDMLHRRGTVTLLEGPEPHAFGWLDGRAHELVLPLMSTRPPEHPPRPRRPASCRPTRGDHGHLPGASSWLYARLFAHPDRHPAILTTHLPELLPTGNGGPEWWFVRHPDPEHHIRLRVRLDTPEAFGATAHRLGAWTERLRQRGLVGRVQLDTYHPETGRFGHGAAMTAAEAVFAADSAAAIAQLTHGNAASCAAVIAAGLVDLVTSFTGSVDDGLRWLLEHVSRTAVPGPDRDVRDHAINLANPHDRFEVLRSSPGGEHIMSAWARRRTALVAYRCALADAGDPNPESVLPDLLHLHYVRMAGICIDGEKACLHLARTAALSWTARTRGAA